MRNVAGVSMKKKQSTSRALSRNIPPVEPDRVRRGKGNVVVRQTENGGRGNNLLRRHEHYLRQHEAYAGQRQRQKQKQ